MSSVSFQSIDPNAKQGFFGSLFGSKPPKTCTECGHAKPDLEQTGANVYYHTPCLNTRIERLFDQEGDTSLCNSDKLIEVIVKRTFPNGVGAAALAIPMRLVGSLALHSMGWGTLAGLGLQAGFSLYMGAPLDQALVGAATHLTVTPLVMGALSLIPVVGYATYLPGVSNLVTQGLTFVIPYGVRLAKGLFFPNLNANLPSWSIYPSECNPESLLVGGIAATVAYEILGIGGLGWNSDSGVLWNLTSNVCTVATSCLVSAGASAAWSVKNYLAKKFFG